jgi:predicted RNA-binding protein Jag
MKSMLHEAASIIKAIEKAWTESGKPAEFTVKILEKGEKNFLGMSKRPAIVSITYGSSFNPVDRPKNKDFAQHRPLKRAQASNFNQVKEQSRDRQIPQKVGVRDEQRRYESPLNSNQSGLEAQQNSVSKDKEKELDREIQTWNNEMADYCSANLKDILAILKIESMFVAKINNKNLVITFDKNITSSVIEDLKSFFASLAHILMQLLKRKYKKRFKGIQIIINYVTSNDASNSNKSN